MLAAERPFFRPEMNAPTLAALLVLAIAAPTLAEVPARPRVLVSTDIGGTDPDDDQSMVHLLVCADALQLEGIVSSPYGPGRKEDILEVVEAYGRDHANLARHSPYYPAPATLRALVKQGALESAGRAGFGHTTEGSDWLVTCARRADERPLHVLVWGGLEDVAQALHDAPDILPKLRVHFIGGPNKMWSVHAYHYLERQHPALWVIESNSTYRGWFVGGEQGAGWGNKSFVSAHVAGRGALGQHFASLLSGTMKMGDSPSVAWLLNGSTDDPTRPGWGGQFVRVWDGRTVVFDRVTTAADVAEAFGVVEFALPAPSGFTAAHRARMLFDRRIPAEGTLVDGVVRFRFSPRDAKVWPWVVESDFPALHGLAGSFTAQLPSEEKTRRVSAAHPHWWTDDPAPGQAEGIHRGARTVNRWRTDFLRHFAERMDRCVP